MTKALDRLLELLDLEQIEVNIFRGRSPDERRQRVFGGQVAGQALVAAGRTVPADRPVHSLHAYFIRPGDPAVPIVYTVDRVRDGRSFTTRRVSAIQHGKTIFTLSASFHHPEPGPEHADQMPDVPPPEMVERTSDRLARLFGEIPPHMQDNPIDLRSVGPLSVEAERDPVAADHEEPRLAAGGRGTAPRPAAARLPDDLRLRHDPARLGAARARAVLGGWPHVGRQPGPRHVVPPAVPGRPVAALRAGLTGGPRRPRPGAWRGVHCRRQARGVGHARGIGPGRGSARPSAAVT